MYRASFALCIVGTLLIALAITLPLVFPMMFEKKLAQKLVISPDSDILKSFTKTPVPFSFQIYIFNLTNAEDVLIGAKPKLNQLGPYTYRMQKERRDIHFNESIGTISSTSVAFYYFQPELSSGKESDIVTTINLAFISLASKFSEDGLPPAIKSIAQLWFLRYDVKPFMTHSVGELLFKGYDEPILKQLYPLTKKENHRIGKTSLYYMRNGTDGNQMEIITGQLGMDNYQQIVKYNGQSKLDFWKEDRCNLINGTNGSQFPRPINTSKPLLLFSPSLCRSIFALYEKDTTLGPLTLHRFVLADAVLKKSEENNCFCLSNFTCRSSMIDVTLCKGSPILISTPHFLGGDLADIEAVEGLNPQQEEHQTFLDVEPNTGVPFRAAQRSQINMPLRRYANFPSLSKVTELIYPILWINQSIEIPVDRAAKLHASLTVPANIVKYGAWIFLITGIILILIAVVLTYKVYKTNQTLFNRRQQLSDKRRVPMENKLLEDRNYQSR